MVTEGVVLGHRVSGRGIEVDRAKIEAIEKLPYPRDIEGISGLLGAADQGNDAAESEPGRPAPAVRPHRQPPGAA